MGKLEIAQDYLAKPSYMMDAVDAFKALAAESTELVNQHIKNFHNVAMTEVPESEPYPTAQAMFDDIEAGQFRVSNLNSIHPQWTQQQNIDFRIAHDILGHYLGRTGFSWEGELAAFKSQRRWYSELAVEALYTEIVGQTACYSVDKVFPAQKVILLESRHGSIELL